MTILIDPARWWWRDRRWSHPVSDESLDELHQFAQHVGIPERGFQGDHYDVPEEYRQQLLDAGAQPVDSRELVRRLRAAGLRLSPAERRKRAGTVTRSSESSAATPTGSDATAVRSPADRADT